MNCLECNYLSRGAEGDATCRKSGKFISEHFLVLGCPNWTSPSPFQAPLDHPVENDYQKNVEGMFFDDLNEVLLEMRTFLLSKNEAYGDSALNPVRIFSKADPIEQIKVRMDDKLSRFSRGKEYLGDNDEKDFCGYSILLRIARLREARKNDSK